MREREEKGAPLSHRITAHLTTRRGSPRGESPRLSHLDSTPSRRAGCRHSPLLLLESLQEVPALVQLPPLLTEGGREGGREGGKQVHQQLLQERPVTGLRERVGWEEEEEEEEEEGEEGERWRRREGSQEK